MTPFAPAITRTRFTQALLSFAVASLLFSLLVDYQLAELGLAEACLEMTVAHLKERYRRFPGWAATPSE